ncbi:MAG: hypothetical protein M1819_003140 [Sarea resinae]|nr:MAG: hypothetical protein M1819_003140 [Sarea resinae]
MNSLAMQIREDINCGADYRLQNPIVIQAYNGLVAYDPLYHAGCLKDSNNNYCFANAVTNTSSPSDSYIYYLALGIALPGGLTPTCNMCLQNTMAILSAAAANTSQPVSTDYAAAAQELDVGCGPSFANSTISRVVKGSDGRSLPVPSFAGIVGVAIGTAMVAVLVG